MPVPLNVDEKDQIKFKKKKPCVGKGSGNHFQARPADERSGLPPKVFPDVKNINNYFFEIVFSFTLSFILLQFYGFIILFHFTSCMYYYYYCYLSLVYGLSAHRTFTVS